MNQAIVTRIDDSASVSYQLYASVMYMDGTNSDPELVSVVPVGLTDSASFKALVLANVLADAAARGYTLINASNVIFLSDNSPAAPSISFPTLAVNTARQASATRNALVIGSVEIDAALTLTSGAKGSVTLQYADNSAFTSGVKTASIGVNGNTGTLSIGINTTQAGGGNIVGYIPAGKYYKFVTTNLVGTPTFGSPVIEEILL